MQHTDVNERTSSAKGLAAVTASRVVDASVLSISWLPSDSLTVIFSLVGNGETAAQ